MKKIEIKTTQSSGFLLGAKLKCTTSEGGINDLFTQEILTSGNIKDIFMGFEKNISNRYQINHKLLKLYFYIKQNFNCT